MVDVRRDFERFEHSGGQVVAITMGNPAQVAAFRRRLRLPFICLADPQREAYRAFGVPRAGLSQIAGPQVWAPAVRALVRGGTGRPVGDIRQLQAAFVVDRSGIVRFAHRGANTADVPSNDRLVAILAGISASDSSS